MRIYTKKSQCLRGHLNIPANRIGRYCRICKNERRRTGVKRGPAPWTHCKYGHEFTPENIVRYGKSGKRSCKICRNEDAKTWKENNPEKAKRIIQNTSRKKLYGMTPEEYDSLFAKQSGKCAICGRDADPLNIDHDHRTNKIRGGLCRTCNVGIGALGDCPELLDRAARYIREAS